jgi:FtsH-binding integral membrane protein
MNLSANMPPAKPVWTRWFLAVSALLAVGGIVAMLLHGPIPQDPNYHCFADGRSFLGIPNFCDVLSNAPFVIFGIMGLGFALGTRGKAMHETERAAWTIFFVGVFLTGFGSGYYHWAPSNSTLVWDRVPMAISFAGLVAALVADRLSLKAATWLLMPLALAGVASVFYWDYTERAGRGDLRPYAIVQFAPLVMIPSVAVAFTTRRLRTPILMHALAWYIAAKVLEALDHQVFNLLTINGVALISGHSLKHIAASIGPLVILLGLKQAATHPSR